MSIPPPIDERDLPLRTGLRVHLVSHTHWDREWYQPASVFRQRLVPLIDALLDAPEGMFLLDGQCVLLTDYLAMRPEREPLLRRRLAEGLLEVGPWYVLADNLIPSGEAILRNLEAGQRVAQRFGATMPAVAYCPDTFGHPAMLPAIAHGYGFPVAIVWRGLGGASHPVADAMEWHAPDGSRVLTYHLPPDGYEVGSALPAGDAEASVRWQRLVSPWRTRNATGVVLLPNGADHHARQRNREEAVHALSAAAARDGSTVKDSSLAGFAQELFEAAEGVVLPAVTGELRDSYGYTWTLQGTFGTRAAQKRANATLERALLRDVEPWLALAWLHASPDAHNVSPDARLTLAQLPSLLERAWESLLRTHPHDTLCGCSTDAVARAMDEGQREVAAQAIGLREAALALALDHDPAVARVGALLANPPLLIRNRVARARGGVCEIMLVDTLGDVPVGPGSASVGGSSPAVSSDRGDVFDRFEREQVEREQVEREQVEREHVDRGEVEQAANFGALLLQSGASTTTFARRESPQHYPDNDRVRVQRALLWVPPIPALGVSVLRDSVAQPVGPSHPVSVQSDDGAITLDNGLVRLRAERDGVTLLMGDRIVRNVLQLESTADCGDSYTASLRGAPRTLSLVRVAVGARGPLRASVRLRWQLERSDIVSLDNDNDNDNDNSNRSTAHRTTVDTELALDADSRVLRFLVHGINRTRDHRLRIVWHTDVSEGVVHADAAFGPVHRDPIAATDAAQRVERVPPTMPLHRWISSSDAAHGVALISDGLAEAEAIDGRIAVTLLRAIGELSRADLPERPGHAGWPVATPASQSLGRFRARFGLLLHDAWSMGTLLDIEDATDDFLLPLRGATLRDYDGEVHALHGIALEGDGLRVSAVTLTRDGTALLLRASNVTDANVYGAWIMPHDGPWEVKPCQLDETPTGPAKVTGARIAFSATPRALTTMCVRRVAAGRHQ